MTGLYSQSFLTPSGFGANLPVIQLSHDKTALMEENPVIQRGWLCRERQSLLQVLDEFNELTQVRILGLNTAARHLEATRVLLHTETLFVFGTEA